MNAKCLAIVRECESGGMSFRSVRREYGEATYRAVRDECVRRGRGAVTLSIIGEVDGVLVAQVSTVS